MAAKKKGRPPGRKRGLTPKQQRFVLEYMRDQNATQAAVRAGYSERTAYAIGNELLGKPLVKAAIERAQAAAALKLEVKAEDVRRELKAIGFSNMGNYVEFDRRGVRLKPSAEMTPEQLAAVSEVRETAEGSLAFKLHGKVEALRLLAQHLGMLVEKHELEHKGATVQIYLPDNKRRDPKPEE